MPLDGYNRYMLPYSYIMQDVKIRSIRDLAAAVRGRRLRLGLDQAGLARRAGVSRKWISEFEAGKPTAEIGLFLRLLSALQLSLSVNGREVEKSDEGAQELDRLLDEYGHGR